ncbi:MAG: type II secretion system protein [Candidatus Wildermuthbacteria bacterium]|nr:type II secretion system protein [Candidatus Wildermuthbacteria bacterium]
MMYHSSPPHNSSKGFTLVEVLVGIALSVLVGAGIWIAQREAFGAQAMIRDSLGAQTEARRALKDITMFVREASSASDGSYPISQALENSFVFYVDQDANGVKERVRYFLNGTTLKKGTVIPSGSPLAYHSADETIQELVHDMANGAQPVFQYYDASYDGSAPPLSFPVAAMNVRLVRVVLIIDKNAGRLPDPFTIGAQVTLRNLKDNL